MKRKQISILIWTVLVGIVFFVYQPIGYDAADLSLSGLRFITRDIPDRGLNYAAGFIFVVALSVWFYYEGKSSKK